MWVLLFVSLAFNAQHSGAYKFAIFHNILLNLENNTRHRYR